jgi:hypothetical protein
LAIVVEFIKDYASWIYGACALVALWYLRKAILARRDRRCAVFSLEREAALNRTYNAWSVAFALILVIGVVYLFSTVVAQAMQPLVLSEQTPSAPVATRALPTPTPPLPAITPTPEAPTPFPTSDMPLATEPPMPTIAVPKPTAAAPAVRPAHCSNAQVEITSPGMGAQVSGVVPVFGSAVYPHMSYYKLEFGAGAHPSVWSYFDGGENPVQGGQLGSLNTRAVPPGLYSIRVVVVDSTGNYPPPCQTTIQVK